MNDYLAKPVRQAALKAMLDEYLNKTKAAQQVITAEPVTGPTPGDRANQGAASKPSKPASTNEKSKDDEAGAPKAKERNGVNGTTKKDTNQEAEEPSSEETATESTAKAEAQTPSKSKRRRIPIKGSTRRPSSTADEKTANGESSTNGTEHIDRSKASSPPSGVKEQALLGKVSTDVISSPENGPTKEEIDGMLSKTITRHKCEPQNGQGVEKESSPAKTSDQSLKGEGVNGAR